MTTNKQKIIITGAAGLLGQNLIVLLKEKGYANLVAIDKHQKNLKILEKIHPEIHTQHADLSQKGDWNKLFHDATSVLMLHAKITGLNSDEFIKDNITATENVISAMNEYDVPYLIHISSSVVNSKAKDDYTNTKIAQEKIVSQSKINHCILRPTLMFGWFDPKHLGWLSRLMEKLPVFPIPGNGKYLRQPLYCRDFCRIIVAVLEKEISGKTYDIVGMEEIYYIDMIKEIKKAKGLRTIILPIPYRLFRWLLKIAGFMIKKPPFTVDQLEALTAGDYFKGVDISQTFGVKPTPLSQAFKETFSRDNPYINIILERTS
ncbi:MAG: NAD-dependent epimerase/dehydratase family protein [Pseudomonadota bacterium]